MRALMLSAVLGAALCAPAMAQQSQQAATASQAIAIAGGGSTGPTEFRGGYDVNNVPALSAYMAVAPCTTAVQAGVSVLGGGGTLSIGGESEGCSIRAYAAAYYTLGRPDIAMRILATAPVVKSVLAEMQKDGTLNAAQPVAVTQRVLPSYCTPQADETATDALMRRANCGK